MSVQMAVFPVNRHKILRPNQRMHQLQFFLTRVPGNVNVRDIRIDDLRSLLQKLIYHIGNRLFISGNRTGGKDDDVIFSDLNGFMIIGRHSRKS